MYTHMYLKFEYECFVHVHIHCTFKNVPVINVWNLNMNVWCMFGELTCLLIALLRTCLSFHFTCVQSMPLYIFFIWVFGVRCHDMIIKATLRDSKLLAAQVREKYFKVFPNLVHQICNYFWSHFCGWLS